MEAYQKISQPYKEEVQDIWEGNIIVEEKVDGSQFRIEITNGVLKCGSHHQDDLSLVDNNFKKATDKALEIFGAYKGSNITVFLEYLSKPKQVTIPYARVPKNNFVLFDVKHDGKYLTRIQKEAFGVVHDLEVVPLLWEGKGEDFTDEIRDKLLATPSYLGHQEGYDRVEGIVVKNYDKWYDVDKYPYLEGHWLCTKIVNQSHKENSKIEHPGAGQKLQDLKDSLRSIPRWRKAFQHLKERNEITLEMKDLGKLIPEVKNDIQEEEIQFIKDELFKLYGRDILDYATKGMAEWYQEFLIEESKQLNTEN